MLRCVAKAIVDWYDDSHARAHNQIHDEADATSVLLHGFSARFLLKRVLVCMNVQILFDDVCVCVCTYLCSMYVCIYVLYVYVCMYVACMYVYVYVQRQLHWR